MSTRTNRYPARCTTCNRHVRANEGILAGKVYSGTRGYRHIVQCHDCTSIPACTGFVAIDDPIRTDPEFLAYCERSQATVAKEVAR